MHSAQIKTFRKTGSPVQGRFADATTDEDASSVQTSIIQHQPIAAKPCFCCGQAASARRILSGFWNEVQVRSGMSLSAMVRSGGVVGSFSEGRPGMAYQRQGILPETQARLQEMAAEMRGLLYGEAGCAEWRTTFCDIEPTGMPVGLELARMSVMSCSTPGPDAIRRNPAAAEWVFTTRSIG